MSFITDDDLMRLRRQELYGGGAKIEREVKRQRVSAQRAAQLRQASRNKYFKEHYGVSSKDVDRMAQLQGGACLICGERSRQLCVDKDEKANVIKGLLCSWCRGGINFMRQKALWDKALAYIGEECEVPKLQAVGNGK